MHFPEKTGVGFWCNMNTTRSKQYSNFSHAACCFSLFPAEQFRSCITAVMQIGPQCHGNQVVMATLCNTSVHRRLSLAPGSVQALQHVGLYWIHPLRTNVVAVAGGHGKIYRTDPGVIIEPRLAFQQIYVMNTSAKCIERNADPEPGPARIKLGFVWASSQ